MTHQPHNPGYPTPQQPGGPGGFSGPGGYGPMPGAVPPPARRTGGPSKLPIFLSAGVAVLGLLAYLASFGPLFNINTSIGPFGGAELTASGLGYWTMAALIAALLAAAGLVVKGKSYSHIVAVAAVFALLLVVAQIVERPNGVSVGWAMWLALLLTLLQAGVAVGALLLESGVITAPAPRPRIDAYGPYGPPPVGYYGQPGVPAQPGAPQPQGYPPFGGAGYRGGSQPQRDHSPETPPSGFPSLGQPAAPPVPPTTPPSPESSDSSAP